MKKFLVLILICAATAAGAAGVITPHWSGAIIDNLVVKESPYIDVRAYGAVCDNTTNDAVAVQAAITAMTSGTLLIPGMCAVGSAGWTGLTVSSKSNISIVCPNDGAGFRLLAQPTQIIAAAGWYPVLLVEDSTHVKITGCTINRNNIESIGIGFDNVSDSEISHNHIYGGTLTDYNTNIATTGLNYRNKYIYNLIEGGGFHGIMAGVNLTNYETRTTIAHNQIRNCEGDAIVYMGAYGDISHNHTDNTNAGVVISSVSGADNTNNIGRYSTANNNIINLTVWHGVQLDANVGSQIEYATISHNTISRSGINGMMTDFASNSVISGNTIYGYGWDNVTGGQGIAVGLGGKNNVISSNRIDGLYPSTKAAVGIAVYIGAQGDYSDNTIIDSNILTNNQYWGVQLSSEGASYSGTTYKIINNIATNNTDGFNFGDEFRDILFSGNTSKNNSRYGLYTGAIPIRSIFGSNNTYSNNVGGNISGVAPIQFMGNGTAIAHLAAVPTAGTWAAGDITYNTGVDNVIGWKCTVAGTPGTWKYMQVTLEP